jgi:DNA-binding transcriptional LysR family regulator
VRFFFGVARAGSLSGAARARYGRRRIALFEKRLGVTLLNRTPDGFSVTSAGDAILRQCTAMENAASDLERIAAGCDSLVAGSVRVTTTEALAYQVVAPAIATLRQAHTGSVFDTEPWSGVPAIPAELSCCGKSSASCQTKRQ